jgi:quinol monooxygenase YgiN
VPADPSAGTPRITHRRESGHLVWRRIRLSPTAICRRLAGPEWETAAVGDFALRGEWRMVWTSGTWRVRVGREDDFIAAWTEFARWSQAAFGGSQAWLLRARDDQQVFVSIGPWPDDATIARWRDSAGFGERVTRIRGLLESFEPRTLDQVVALT